LIAVAEAEFRYSDLLPTGSDDTPYRLDLVAQEAAGCVKYLRGISVSNIVDTPTPRRFSLNANPTSNMTFGFTVILCESAPPNLSFRIFGS
jgi:hypothetical protein